MATTQKSVSGFGAVFIVCWIAGWTVGTLSGDINAFRNLVSQIRTERFSTASGTIMTAIMEEEADSEGGTSYSPRFTYSFTAGGKTFQGARYRFGPVPHSRRKVQEILDAFPRGKNVPVFYDSADPGKCVLNNLLAGGDFSQLMFLIPFNLILIASWYFLATFLHERYFPAGIRDVTILRRRPFLIARMGDPHPALWSGIVVGGASFLLVAVFEFLFRGDPPLDIVAMAFCLLLLVALGAYLYFARRQESGDYDLIIDSEARRLALPSPWGSGKRLEMDFGQIRDISVEVVSSADSDGKTTTSIYPTILWKTASGEIQNVRMDFFRDEGSAHAFLAWLESNVSGPTA